MLTSLVETALGFAIQAPILKLTGCRVGSKTFEALRQHFLGKRELLGQAMQDSFYASVSMIEEGARSDSMWERVKGITRSRVSKAFGEAMVQPCLEAYAKQRGFNEKQHLVFAKTLARATAVVQDKCDKLLPLDLLEDPDIARLLNQQVSERALQQILSERLRILHFDRDFPTVLEFWKQKGLLVQAFYQCFREELLGNKKIKEIITYLNQQGIDTQLDLMQASQDEVKALVESRMQSLEAQVVAQQEAIQLAVAERRFQEIPALGTYQETVELELSAVKETLDEFGASLAEAKKMWSDFGEELSSLRETFAQGYEELQSSIGEVQEGLRQVEAVVEQELQGLESRLTGIEGKLEQLVQMMQRNRIQERLSIRSFHSVAHNEDVKEIRHIAQQLKELGREHNAFAKASVKVGAALSAVGCVEEAEPHLERALEAARESNQAQTVALASYNLFQVQLQRGAHQKALHSLQEAVSLDRQSYLPFNMDRYNPIRILGAGGMGCAFLCEDLLEKNQKRVIKTFWEAKTGPIANVFQEAFMMQRTDRKGEFTPHVYSIEYADALNRSGPYIVMEYVEGALDGEAFLREHGKLNAVQGLELGLTIARALEKAHANGVLHLDLKPANLLLREHDDGIDVKIIDFGLAKAANSMRDEIVQRSRSGMTMVGQQIFGTLHYAPPEQWGDKGFGKPSERSDLYAFAATLYRLMSQAEPRTINRRALPSVPHSFYELLCDCLEQNPAKRPSSAAEVVQRLESIDFEIERFPPFFREAMSHALSDHILDASEESMLWVMQSSAGLSMTGPEFCAFIEESLIRHEARRQLAMRAEKWMLQQAPNRYEFSQIWAALQEHAPSVVYAIQESTPWLRQPMVLAQDSAFAEGPAAHFALEAWGLEPWVEYVEVETTAGSDKVLQEDEEEDSLSVGRICRRLGLHYKLWVRALHPETGEFVPDDTAASLVRVAGADDSVEMSFSGRSRVGRVRKLLEQSTGLRLALLGEDGEILDDTWRINAHRGTASTWILKTGPTLFFTLKPENKGRLLWKQRGLLTFGRYSDVWFPEQEELEVFWNTAEGRFPVLLSCSRNAFLRLSDFFEAYPDLLPGDVLALTRIEPDHFDVEIFRDVYPEFRRTEADDMVASTDQAVEDVTIAGATSGEVASSYTETSPAEPTQAAEAEAVTLAEKVGAASGEETQQPSDIDTAPVVLGRESSADGDEERELARLVAEEDDDETLMLDAEVVSDTVMSEVEVPAVALPLGSEGDVVTVDRFVKEMAQEYRIALRVLDPETSESASPDSNIETLRLHPPHPDDLALYGNSTVALAQERLGHVTGLSVLVLDALSLKPAPKEMRLSKLWLPSRARVSCMGRSLFFSLKPLSARSKSLPWRRYGRLNFGKYFCTLMFDSALKAGETSRSITLLSEQGKFEALLDFEGSRFTGMREFFRAFPELEPGDVLCLTEVDETHFQVEFFLKSEESDDSEEVVEVVEEDEDTQEAEEPKTVVAETKCVETLEATTTASYEELLSEANRALEEEDVQTAWSGYQLLREVYQSRLEEDLEAYRRVAAARLYREGLEFAEYDTGQALAKFRGVAALDASFLPGEVQSWIDRLGAEQRKLRERRFYRLCKEGCQVAPTDPEAALEYFVQARRLAPYLWEENEVLQQWDDYARQLIAYRRPASH